MNGNRIFQMFDKNRKEIDFMNPKVKPPANLYDDKGIPV